MAEACIKARVTGRVQGVFYRVSTRQHASTLGLNGYVRNLTDGDVEVMAWGPQEQVDALLAWLWQGPEHAQVEQVIWEAADAQDCEGFEIR